MPRKGPDPELVAQILVESDILGHEEAAKRYGVSKRTIERYSSERRADPDVAELVAQKRKRLAGDWIERTDKARKALLDAIVGKIDGGELRDLVGAAKIVHEMNVSERLIGLEDGDVGRLDHPHSAPTEAPPAEGEEETRGPTARGVTEH